MDFFMGLLPERVVSDNVLRKVGTLIDWRCVGSKAGKVRSLPDRKPEQAKVGTPGLHAVEAVPHLLNTSRIISRLAISKCAGPVRMSCQLLAT